MESNDLEESPIKQQIWKLLDNDPILKPKTICLILKLPYQKYHNYVTRIRSLWKHYSKNEQLSKRLNFHNWHGFVFVPKSVDRSKAVDAGWKETKSKNKWLLWKEVRGRLEWHTSGRVRIYVRKPANPGKMAQLLANAFHMNALIPDIRVFEAFRQNVRFKGAHATVDLGERLPYCSLNFLQNSNGVKVKTGDLSHPTCLEVEFHYPDYAEKCEIAMNKFVEGLERMFGSPRVEKEKEDTQYRV
jgi:hypothetical protein